MRLSNANHPAEGPTGAVFPSSAGAVVRVWPAGAPGVILRISGGRLVGVDTEPDPNDKVCDPASPESLVGAEGLRGQLELVRFLARAFGASSPLFRSPHLFRRELDQRYSVHPHDHEILDVGCGGPALARDEDPNCGRLVGLDLWPEPDERPGVSYRQLNTDGTFPFQDAAFGAVRGLFVLEHVADLSLFVRELARVTRPGGRVVLVTTHCPAHADPFAALSLGHFREFTSVSRRGPAWLVTLSAVETLLHKAGLVVVSTNGSKVNEPSNLEWCALRPGSPSVAEQLWIEARKGGGS